MSDDKPQGDLEKLAELDPDGPISYIPSLDAGFDGRLLRLGRAQSAVRNMSKGEIREFVEWLRSEGVI